jgi:hypothetical protein
VDAADSDAAVPGGAEITVPAGSPPICAALARSAALRSLGLALVDLSDPQLAADATDTVRRAATDLIVLAEEADANFAAEMRQAADALEEMAERGLTGTVPERDAAGDPAMSLHRLGEEVQRVCDLPVG